jgi:hypothetical protein
MPDSQNYCLIHRINPVHQILHHRNSDTRNQGPAVSNFVHNEVPKQVRLNLVKTLVARLRAPARFFFIWVVSSVRSFVRVAVLRSLFCCKNPTSFGWLVGLQARACVITAVRSSMNWFVSEKLLLVVFRFLLFCLPWCASCLFPRFVTNALSRPPMKV